jgi:hypothetical protein
VRSSMSMSWLFFSRRFVKSARTASCIVRNWFDLLFSFKHQFEIWKACETETSVRWTSDDRRLMRILSKELFVESTVEDCCLLYSSEYIDLISREHKRSADVWTLSRKDSSFLTYLFFWHVLGCPIYRKNHMQLPRHGTSWSSWPTLLPKWYRI